MKRNEDPTVSTGLEIAVIGMAGRFPGARNVQELWRNLHDGVESISFFSDEELLAAGQDPVLIHDPGYVRAQGVLADADLFDAEFFGYSPREAEITDPQQRIFLECAWEALEDAGYDPQRYPGLIGVYGGVSRSSYAFHLLSQPHLLRKLGMHQLAIGNEKDFLCARVSYKLNLEGPSLVVQSACSTSLVAVHLASQALLSGECDMALAGGVSVVFPQQSGHLYQKGGVASPDGHCRAFDSQAQGTVGGHGAGIVVLKRLADALADGDAVRAVIRGTAVNNDGFQKAGFTAPRVEGQASVILAALQMAEVDPETVTYVEAHGTATELGDPIEIAALTRAFRTHTARTGFCAVGSVKTNIGHLDAAAGVASLIKTILALEHGQIPPSLHFQQPNPEIDFTNSPFYVNATLADWPATSGPRRVGVSSFGLGGTNAHAVLEEAPSQTSPLSRRPWQLLPLSARSAQALEVMTDNLVEHLHSHPALELPDVAHTLQAGRRRFEHRRFLVCRDRCEAVAALSGRDATRIATAAQPRDGAEVAFLFSGLGDHHVGMGFGLYQTEPVFREAVDRACAILEPHLELDLRPLLYPDREREEDLGAGEVSGLDLRAMLGRRDGSDADVGLHRTAVAQPALFVVEHALAELWRSWGIRPTRMIGYSLGEYVAACQAGVLSLEDALALVARRAQLIEGLPAGSMLAVPLSEADLQAVLGPGLSLAAVNGPALCVVAGPPLAVAALEQELAGRGVPVRPLQTSHAFHSRMMEPIADAFLELVQRVELKPPQIHYLSNVTGGWISAEEAMDPAYWVRHLCQTVRFADGLAMLWRERGLLLLEVGPGQALCSLALQHPEADLGGRAAVPSLPHAYDRQPTPAFLLRSLGQLWLAGAAVDWDGFASGEERRRVPLPTYPFERKRFWIERREAAPALEEAVREPSGKTPDPADWFYIPSWKRSMPPPALSEPAAGERWLLLVDRAGMGLLAERLETAGRSVVQARPGKGFHRLGERFYELDPSDGNAWDALLADLGGAPDRVVHLWTLGLAEVGEALEAFEAAQTLGFHSLIALAQALGRQGLSGVVEICVVSDGLCGVEKSDLPLVEKATLLGPVKVIPQEYPEVVCRMVDVDTLAVDDLWVERLLAELAGRAVDPVVAWRGPYRWVPSVEPVRLASVAERSVQLREGGVYLITGGLGGIGLALAHFLARTAGARLVLTGRSPLPERSEWPRCSREGGDLARRIREITDLEAMGAQVLALAADVADEEQMREVMAQIDERFGRIDGVFHAAGLPGAGLVQLKTRAMAAAVFAPKAHGALVLESVLRGRRLDFLVLFSSIAWLRGEIGQVDYCAANAFLGAFAQRHHLQGGLPILTIDWCQWQWDGWKDASALLAPELQRELSRRRQTFGLTFDEGMEALVRCLDSGLPQVLVSTQDLLASSVSQLSITDVVEEMERARSRDGSRHPRPVLGVPYVAPADGMERDLAALWEALLGIQPIGVHDNFFDLGGHSLLGIQLLIRIRDRCGVDLPLRTLFEAPTIAAMVGAIAQDRGAAAVSAPPELQRTWGESAVLLENLDRLSDADVDGLLVDILSREEDGGGLA